MIHGCGVAMCAVDKCVPGLTPGGASPAPTRNEERYGTDENGQGYEKQDQEAAAAQSSAHQR